MNIAIIGAGVMGLMTADLLQQSHKVTIYEKGSKGAPSPSNDYSRLFRSAYGGDSTYETMAALAGQQWKSQFSAFIRLVDCLLFGKRLIEANSSLGQSHLEYLSPSEMAARYPEFLAREAIVDRSAMVINSRGVYEHLLKNSRATIRYDTPALAVTQNRVSTHSDETTYDAVIITCGAGINQLKLPLPHITASPRKITYIKDSSAHNGSAAFADMDTGFFGVPSIAGCGYKIANHLYDTATDFDGVHKLAKYIPGMAAATISTEANCVYDISPDDDFIIDKLGANTYIAAGFSGHGYKFAPLIAQYISDQINGNTPQVDMERFSLARFRD